jgi:hypothetical protein
METTAGLTRWATSTTIVRRGEPTGAVGALDAEASAADVADAEAIGADAAGCWSARATPTGSSAPATEDFAPDAVSMAVSSMPAPTPIPNAANAAIRPIQDEMPRRI